ncbi:MAG: sulfurtransferase TusB [Persephonella sp.]|nr:MAG: sulfurtransferase TusB [Persephonella sp.]
MVNKVWLIRKPNDYPEAEVLEENDVIILIQDAVLKIPYLDNILVCKDDALARNVKVEEDLLIDYEDIIDIIEKAEKVVVW